MIIIAVGSTNPIKIQAVAEVLKHSFLEQAQIQAVSASSEIQEQPLSLEETILGAKNRAKNAFALCAGCSYSFGIESGLFPAQGTATGFLEACICAIFDGKKYAVGLSCGFEVPHPVLRLIVEKNLDLNQACYEAGLSTNEKLGQAEGIIGMLTKGRIPRKEYTKQCVTTALIQLENPNLY